MRVYGYRKWQDCLLTMHPPTRGHIPIPCIRLAAFEILGAASFPTKRIPCHACTKCTNHGFPINIQVSCKEPCLGPAEMDIASARPAAHDGHVIQRMRYHIVSTGKKVGRSDPNM